MCMANKFVCGWECWRGSVCVYVMCVVMIVFGFVVRDGQQGAKMCIPFVVLIKCNNKESSVVCMHTVN